MSRRGLGIFIFIMAVAIGAVFFLRANNEASESPTSTQNSSENLGPETPSATDESPSTAAKKTPSSISEATPSTEDSSSHLPGRGNFANRPVGGKKTFDASQAKVNNDAAFVGTSWKVWTGVTAFPKNKGEPIGKLLGEVNGFYLVDEGSLSSSEAFDPAKPLVVLAQNGSAGVVTGNFAVTLEDGASAAFLSQSPQVQVVGSFPEINTYYVTSSQVPFSLKTFNDALKEAPEVKDVKMEILDRQYEKF